MCSKYYNPKISLTMAKNAKRNLDKMAMEEVKRQVKEAARKGPRSVAKNPILYNDKYTQVFNRKFHESIGLVMSQIPALLGKGISITKVNVKRDYSEVRVFWVAKEEEVVTNILHENSKIIRQGMKECSGLGKLPMIVYLMDKNYLFACQMDRLFDKLDVGPDINETEDNQWKEELELLELGSDGGGLRRDVILDSVHKALQKSKALHRGQYSAEQFQTAYRETIERHGGAHKLEVKNKIRKFLVSRNKATQRAREENKTMPVYFGDE